MKRVRCLAGAAALSPLAVGMALPATAQAATTHSQTRGKSVSLNPAVVAAINHGCAGTDHFSIASNGNVRGGGWDTHIEDPKVHSGLCIGTVVASMKFNKGTAASPFCKDVWISAHRAGMFGDASYVKPAHKEICGKAGTWKTTTFGLHDSWSISGIGSHVRLVVFSTYNTTGAGINLP